jgi:4-amino-4-deoxy-L-arabinose transferase-like glycosyltransferase
MSQRRATEGSIPAGRAWTWLIPGLVVYAICRIPSFFEPHWYTDEAGYATTARAVLRGAPLYLQAWTNKPPLHIWAVALPLSLFGPREAGLHALTFLSGLLAFVALALLARRLLSPHRALIATVAFGLALGLPLFQAELLVPESLLIAPTTWAGLIVLTRLLPTAASAAGNWRWALLAGGLMGLAVGFQQTALADVLVFALIIALMPGVSRRALPAYLLAVLLVITCWLTPALLVAGVPAVAFALVGFYQSYVAFSTPNSSIGIGLRLLGPALALMGTVIVRRDPRATWPLWLWACADLGVSAIANRPYPHFLVPALAPTILALASIRGIRLPIRWRLAPLAAAFLLTVPLALVAGTDFNLLQAYAAWPAAQLGQHRTEWSAQLDVRSPADEATAVWIRQRGLAQSTAVIWSSDAWLYLLADLPMDLPTAPIYNDVVLLGSGSAVATRVDQMQPQLIVTSDEALSQWPEIGPVLDRDYVLVFRSDPNSVYLRRPGP